VESYLTLTATPMEMIRHYTAAIDRLPPCGRGHQRHSIEYITV